MLADVGRIIVVDDDATLRQMVIRYLEEHSVPTRLRPIGPNCTAILRGRSLA
jgi:DNA-binding response OmpR family regulator